MSNLLQNAGWTVLEAKDGIDALDKLPLAEERPRLFLLDIEMPRMDGYQLLATLRSQAEHHDTPIVMVTSRAGDKHRQKAMQLGATDYVVKPYQDDELLSLIRRLLAGREAVLS
jgi:CheY-like chemotaxis protein